MLVMAVGLTCGCTVIPVGAPTIVEEAPVGDPMLKQFVRMVASPPRNEWSPQAVVEGMLAAMAAYPDDPETLMKYFTSQRRSTWSAAGPVTVIDAAQLKEENGKIRLTGNKIARIDNDDRYVPMTGKLDREVVLKKEGGGWRVDAMDDGILLTAADVARAYRSTRLYFLNGAPTPDGLVGDPVHLRLKPTENYAETIVERLLRGPSSALRGAVGSALPEHLSVDSVTASDERVVINLTGAIDPETDMNGLKAQLRWSLDSVASGRTIEVQIDSEPFTSSDPMLIAPNFKEDWLTTRVGTAYYTSGGEVHTMGGEGPGNPVNGPAGQPNSYTDLAISRNGGQVAGGAKDGIWVTKVAPGVQWDLAIEGSRLTAPSWHRDGSLWTYDKRSGAVLRRDNPEVPGTPVRVAAPALDGLDVTDLRLARDGVRVAVGVGASVVKVGAITGGSSAMMLGNFETLLTVNDGEEIRDIAWRDGEHLLVLVSSKAGQIVKEINVGDGETTQLTSDKRLKTIAALGDRILAGTEEGGEILEFKDQQGWTSKIKESAQTPIFPLG